jgi:hypothetical protein
MQSWNERSATRMTCSTARRTRRLGRATSSGTLALSRPHPAGRGQDGFLTEPLELDCLREALEHHGLCSAEQHAQSGATPTLPRKQVAQRAADDPEA